MLVGYIKNCLCVTVESGHFFDPACGSHQHLQKMQHRCKQESCCIGNPLSTLSVSVRLSVTQSNSFRTSGVVACVELWHCFKKNARNAPKEEAALFSLTPLHPCYCDESSVERFCAQDPHVLQSVFVFF